jgi:DNA repair protein RecN (Recombination protein N)
MLRFLAVRRLAVIDALDVEFTPGLSVLTGETGAGKSMLVEAVGLLVGGRASPDLVRTGEDTATVQAIFDTPDGREIIVRREVSAQGRSRAFIDDALATTAALRDACGGLVDLHGQHDHQQLLDPASHLDIVDEFGALHETRSAVAGAYRSWRTLQTEFDAMRRAEREKGSRLDLVTFQLNEIDRVAPKPAEDEELASARQILANADKLSRLCTEAYQALYEGDDAALASLGGVWKRVTELSAVDARFQPYIDARETIKSQLEDLAYFLRSYAANIDASPERLQEVEDRLAALERLKKKHGPSLADVLARQAELRSERELLDHAGDRAAALERELAAAREGFLKAAHRLSSARQEAAPRLCRAIEKAVAELAMPKTRCEMRLAVASEEREWTEHGIDSGELYFSPNPGEDVRPLAKIASGGELSRVTLALKTLVATDAPGKTLIFDEVDAGIGGAVADIVGARLRRLGGRYQVLCITHLPQIAAYGEAHYRIEKFVKAGRTVTTVTSISGSAREEEIARMIGGTDLNPAVRASARAMLETRGEMAGPVKRRQRI